MLRAEVAIVAKGVENRPGVGVLLEVLWHVLRGGADDAAVEELTHPGRLKVLQRLMRKTVNNEAIHSSVLSHNP